MKIPISVIMPSCGSPEVAAEAVKSLREHAKMDFQLVFVDNGSERKELMCEAIRPHMGTKDVFIRNDVNRSFSRANNQALSLADGEYVVGFNDDIVAHGDWQTPLLTEGLDYDLCGPTIRRLVICDELRTMLCHRPNGKMADADPSEVGSYLECWCFFIRKEYFRMLGGFDEVFWPMFCEDSDLSFRVKAMGGKLGKVAVPVRHLGSVNTRKYFDKTYRDAVSAANAHKLYARWVKGAII